MKLTENVPAGYRSAKHPAGRGWLHQLVRHRRYGIGEVVEEWGIFASCPECFASVPFYQNTRCHNKKPAMVSGAGIVDVRFADGKTHSINVQWLDRMP